MKTNQRTLLVIIGAAFTILMFGDGSVGRLGAKEKTPPISPDDPTVRLYNLLDSKYNGKLDGFCLLAEVYNDPKNPGQPQQHVLRVEYEKDRAFGKLRIYVRQVAQLTPDQLKTYSPKQIYDFAVIDTAKFTKTDPGSFGRTGDLYFEPASEGGALKTAPVTPEAVAQYEHTITDYLLPALQKKAAGGITP